MSRLTVTSSFRRVPASVMPSIRTRLSASKSYKGGNDMSYIQNPILPGFHPDPSIIRVGDDYYIAVSTFEWFPGVAIYHSQDLANWNLVSRPLNRLSQLDM